MSSKDIEFQIYTLGDVKVIELLLTLRYRYDDNMTANDDNLSMCASGGYRINEEVMATYIDLDKCIRDSNLNETQRKMIDMISKGYSHEEIAYEVSIPHSGVKTRLETIYKEIKKENDRKWRKYIYNNKIGLKNKRCSKCKEEYPATPEFYADLSRTRDGFHSQCRKCKK